MRFKNIKINKKVKIYDLLDKKNYIKFVLSITLISFLILLLFGIPFYTIASEGTKTIIKNIIYLFFTLLLPSLFFIFTFSYFFYFAYYAKADNIKGLIKSRYLPISDDEIKKLNINNLNDYLEFVDNFTKEKYILNEGYYYYILYLHDKHIEFMNELAEKEYNEDIIFIETHYINDNYFNRFCLLKKDKRIYFAFQSDNTKYYKPSYDIDYENKIYGDEIIYIE